MPTAAAARWRFRSRTEEIGLFAADPSRVTHAAADVIAMRLDPVRSGRRVATFVTNRRPSFAAIDPASLYIDRGSAEKKRVAAAP